MVKFIGLKIQGIRSIGDAPQCINFLTPLTIIQGPNGTGKTTIIEALNYVTTGALPAGKMQTFIHNNQIANKPRVDALVQLEFTDIRAATCTATKRMNASTSRGGKLTTKSDEFTLRIVDKHNVQRSISSKVADFNKEILNRLGVPKAVLEYVLFCHQEESNWPLSEPKELKMRFDAIFEVTKYVKALDNVKKNVKNLNHQIQLIDRELPHLENNLKAKADLQLKYGDSLASLKQMRRTIEKLVENKRELETELVSTRKQHERAQKTDHDLEVLQGKIQTHMHHIGTMGSPELSSLSREEILEEIKNIKEARQLNDAEGRHASIVIEVQEIAHEINMRRMAKEKIQEQLMEQKSQQMVMQNRETEYVTLLQQYSKKFDVIVDQNFVQNLNSKVLQLETESNKFIENERERQGSLSEKIEKLQIKTAELKSNALNKRQELLKLSQSISNTERELKSSENTTQAIGRLSQEITKWETQLKSLGDFRLLDVIWDDLQVLQGELNTIRMDMLEIGDIQTLDSFRDRTAPMLEAASEKLNATLDQVGILKKRVQVTKQLTEFKERKVLAGEKAFQFEALKQGLSDKKEQIEQIENVIAVSKRNLPDVENELRMLEFEREKIVREISLKERDSFRLKESINNAIAKIDELKAVIEKDRPPDLAKIHSQTNIKLEEENTKLEQLMERKMELDGKLAGVDDSKEQLMRLEQQIKRINALEEVQKLRKELEDAKLNAQLNGIENLAEIIRKEQKINQQTLSVSNQIHQKNGEQLQLRKKIADLKTQLDEPRYKNAKTLYLEQMAERQIMKGAIEDLEQYYKIVDDAIINFHQRKMEQINHILRELWSRVYQGSDIETIKIKSQPVSDAEKKKSYDYSVVMTVDQTDIDMRDRCSAGQKVLASILIRIALADVFAGNCRILALDEPTTNLDADKVENIGTMLKSLIEIQAQPSAGAFGARGLYEANEVDFDGISDQDPEQSGNVTHVGTHPLQLIVITHDRRLVEHLHLACRPDYIYGLSKDGNGVSRIKKYSQLSADLNSFS